MLQNLHPHCLLFRIVIHYGLDGILGNIRPLRKQINDLIIRLNIFLHAVFLHVPQGRLHKLHVTTTTNVKRCERVDDGFEVFLVAFLRWFALEEFLGQ